MKGNIFTSVLAVTVAFAHLQLPVGFEIPRDHKLAFNHMHSFSPEDPVARGQENLYSTMEHIDDAQYDGIDPSVSPFESIETNTTPNTEFSPPGSPIRKTAILNDCRSQAREKLSRLTLEEKVRSVGR